MTWWWLSFADPHRPTGEQFLGVAIVEAPDFVEAVQRAHALGINPGGQVEGYPYIAPPEGTTDRLLTRADLEEADLA